MFIELMAIHGILTKWLRNPAARICDISNHANEKRTRPYTPEEIQSMRSIMKRHNWTTYMQLFYGDGKSSIWEPSWPKQYNPQSVRDLAKQMPKSVSEN